MRFHLSPEQEALQDTLARTVERACPPARRRALLEAESDHDPAVWEALMATGLGGLLIPEEERGVGLDLEATALALEVLGQSATPGDVLGQVLAGWAVAQSGDAALISRWLPRLASGEAHAALALEDGDVAAWRLDASAGRLTGAVRFVPGADHATLFIVGVQQGLVLVEAGDDVRPAPVAGSDVTRRLWSVTFDQAPATPIGSPQTATRLVDAALVLLAADALGGAQQCLDMSVAYAKTREQFGGPIGRFQALKHQLADMALQVEPARALVWYAAHAWDHQLPDAPRAAAHAKAHLADRFVSVARAAVQAHGGIGYTWDYDLQLWFRRSLYDRAYLGSPALHRARAAALAGW